MLLNGKKRNDSPVIVIDCHAVGWAMKHVHGVLSYDDRPTGVVYGFLNQILTLFKRFDSNKFVFAWDSGRSLRKDIYLYYKNRAEERTEEEIEEYKIAKKQFVLLRQKILPTMGFKNVFIQTGYEADDIMASVVMRNSHYFIIGSDDKDLYQLLGHCDMWKLRKKSIYTDQDLMNEWDATPETWAKQKQYSGCKGDNAPNIPGVRDKTAIKYVRGCLKGKKLQDILSTPKEFILRNKKLTTLPLEGTKTFNIDLNENFQITDFIRLFEHYGFYSFMKKKKLQGWKEFCRAY